MPETLLLAQAGEDGVFRVEDEIPLTEEEYDRMIRGHARRGLESMLEDIRREEDDRLKVRFTFIGGLFPVDNEKRARDALLSGLTAT